MLLRSGLISPGDDLPIPSFVVRYVSPSRMGSDPYNNDRIVGPLPEAFRERPGDQELSVTWCEYFQGGSEAQLRCAIEAIRKSKLKVSKTACFCVANTNDLFDTISGYGRKGRAVFLPEDDNPAHSGIYGISPAELTLLEKLASETWRAFLTKSMADALPTSECEKSPFVA